MGIGLDLGTGGARAVIARADGEVVASGAATLALSRSSTQPGRHEQDPAAWWRAARTAIESAVASLPSQSRRAIHALCVDGTSGTVVGVDSQGAVTTPALMYNDSRAELEARELDDLAEEATGDRPGISASWGLAKMRWLERHAPAEFEATHCFAHQADLVAARLTGRCGLSDSSNALKSGFDLEAGSWAGWLDELPALRARLPEVVEPAEVLGVVTAEVAQELGIPADTRVVAGVTDGTAAFLASGASRSGDDNTTLGTTLVFKRIASAQVRDPDGALYCHRLPGGVWLPGAASNVGGDWIRKEFGAADLGALDEGAGRLMPIETLAYPLSVPGERFPFRAEGAEGFVDPPTDDPRTIYAAKLQGTALLERLAYEVLDRHAPSSGEVFATGGGSASDVWMQLRADVTGRTYHRPACPESAFGSAVLALAGVLERDLWETSRGMVRSVNSFRPRASRHALYSEYYRRFLALLEQRGYLPSTPPA